MNYEMVFGYEGLPFGMSIHGVNERKTHWHNHIEFLLVLDGSVELRLRDKKYTLIKDDLFLINDKEIHNVMRTTEENLLLILKIDIKYYLNYYSKFKNMILENNYFNKEENRERANIYKEHMAKIVWEYSKKEPGYRLKIGSEVNLLLANIMKSLDKVQLKEHTIKNEDEKFLKIEKIMDYIDKNFQQGIDLDRVVEEFYFSRSYLSRFFKEMTGMTFQQYLNYTRLDKASQLLLATNKSITEIAVESGVNNVKTLNRLFREYYDSSPSEYRDKYNDINKEVQQKIDIKDKRTNSYLPIDISKAYKIVFEYLDINKEDDRI